MSRQKELTIPLNVARWLRDTHGMALKGATLAQTLGPHWRDIVWIPGSSGKKADRTCYVCDTHQITELKRLAAGFPG